MYKKELENLEKLRKKLESKTYEKPVYSSMVSYTRNGCMNRTLRMNNDYALPVRITVRDYIEESLSTSSSDVSLSVVAARWNPVWLLFGTSFSWFGVFAYAAALSAKEDNDPLLSCAATTVFCTALFSCMHWIDYREDGVRKQTDKVVATLSFLFFTVLAIGRVREIKLLIFGWPVWIVMIIAYRLSFKWGHPIGKPEVDNCHLERWVFAHALFHVCVGSGQAVILYGATIPNNSSLF